MPSPYIVAVRRPDNTPAELLQPGEYARQGQRWILRDPKGRISEAGSFHSTVTENRDGDIFVTPPIGSVVEPLDDGTASFFAPTDPDIWYGWIEAGFWKPIPHPVKLRAPQ
jgi:hypothetical protein